MKRYYVCKIIGDGIEPETAFRPAIHDIIDPSTGMRAFDYSAAIVTDENGQPVSDWCLVIAAGRDHKLAANNPDIDQLPDYPLDAKIAAMHTPAKNQAMARLQSRGINTGKFANADGYRDLIRGLGKEHDANFSEDSFDVSDQ